MPSLRSALKHAQDELSAVESEIARLNHERERLAAEVRGLTLALNRNGTGNPQLDAGGPLTAAVLAVLDAAGASMSPVEVTAQLHEAGRTETRPVVTSTLQYLVKQGRVERPARGRYRLVSP